MKKFFLLTSLILIWFSSVLSAITNSEIISMLGAGIGEETVIAAIKASPKADLDTDSTALIKLKEAGASDEVLQAIITRAAGKPAAAAPSDDNDNPMSRFDTLADEVSILPPEVTIEAGNIYYTRHTLKYERADWPATNYWRGVVLPINTRVRVMKFHRGRVYTQIAETGEQLNFKNIEKYTQLPLEGFASQMLSAEPTPIEEYGEEIADDIRMGNMKIGMTKQQILLTRGYPPKHKTQSLEMDRWTFWSSRFVKRTLLFADDILIEGRGLN